MAPRKPKNPIKDISDAVGGWLGGNRGTINPQVARVSRDLGTVAQTIDTFTGGLGAAAVRDVRNFAQGGSLPTNLAKTAAVNLAAGAVGAGVGKAAVGMGRVVSKTGVPARVVNKLTGQKVVVHASPQTGLNRIDPRLGSNQLPDKNVVFGWDPKKSGMRDQITRLSGRYVSKQEGQSAGSIYVTSIRKSEIVTPQNLANTGQVVSRGSGRVVSEIPVSGKTTAQVNAELQRQLRLAGAVSKPAVSRTADAAERVRSKVGQTFMTKAQKDAARRKRIR
jgi:hypothetical protein